MQHVWHFNAENSLRKQQPRYLDSMSPDKAQVIAAIVTKLRESLDAVERIAQMARDETTGGESKAEGKYDTRSTEASYLARGQAWRVAELRQLFAWFSNLDTQNPPTASRAQNGALVQLEGEQRETLFLAPAGGTQVVVGGQTIRVISPKSPLGEAMADAETGDVFEVNTPRGPLTYEVVSIQ